MTLPIRANWKSHFQWVTNTEGIYDADVDDSESSTNVIHKPFEVVHGIFKQSDPNTNHEDIDVSDGFGLVSGTKWSSVIELLHESDGPIKLLFLQRHGEGYHNIAPSKYNYKDWVCRWQMADGDDEYEWYDAELTSRGFDQLQGVRNRWDTEISLGCPKPESHYVSPLRRTLETYDLIWNERNHVTKPVVSELIRETYGISTESKRHPKSYIEERWPYVHFESNFTEHDNNWTPLLHETHQHRKYRARLFLQNLFKNDKNTIVHVTSHSGFISSLLKVVGHRNWDLGTGQMIPVLIKANSLKLRPPHLNKSWHSLPHQCENYGHNHETTEVSILNNL
ncbi:uncharacterized protein KQ657_003279 [Scheffersomyces spartinae]|uniref:Uncharacterized protein n=1 Tax=Scheffersomyces spartinae TaxID=45513 RepID=A0A9P7VCM8_9ASCO|nr:uncharacterized protein KQ657_003279 [Scheffersomyces spartinae]KAG7195516.1 hypothetical protein KQ657_003279 [Scheffersomyces spartinae]